MESYLVGQLSSSVLDVADNAFGDAQCLAGIRLRGLAVRQESFLRRILSPIHAVQEHGVVKRQLDPRPVHSYIRTLVRSWFRVPGRLTPSHLHGTARHEGGGKPIADQNAGDRREFRATYYAARNNNYAVPRAASFAGKALTLAQDPRQGLSPPHGPYREGRAAAPPRTLPRTVRSGRDCRLFYAPHSRSNVGHFGDRRLPGYYLPWNGRQELTGSRE